MGIDLVSLPRNGSAKTVIDKMIYRRVTARRRCSSFVYFSACMNYFVICSVVLSTFLLVWCGSAGTWTSREVTVGSYVFSLPEAYTSVSPSLVENKQLTNKVIWSFKRSSSTTSGFEPNIIVTRSVIAPSLNFEQFRTLNTQKLQAELAGYQPGKKEVRAFSCGDRTIQGLIVFFRLQDPWSTKSPEVRLAQYQFVDQEQGYIISAAYETEQDQQWFVDIVDTLSCVVDSASTGSVQK